MNERPFASLLPQSLSEEATQGLIKSFEDRFESRSGKAHLYLAYHAAFPLMLTPDLLIVCTETSHTTIMASRSISPG